MPFFEVQKDIPTTIDYSTCKEISVIAVYNPEGRIKPLYAKLEDLYGNVCTTAIEGVKYTKDGKNKISYCCTYKAGDVLRECMLTFYVTEHKWVLENPRY